MICSKCGNQNTPNDLFCTKCGNKLESGTPQQLNNGQSPFPQPEVGQPVVGEAAPVTQSTINPTMTNEQVQVPQQVVNQPAPNEPSPISQPIFNQQVANEQIQIPQQVVPQPASNEQVNSDMKIWAVLSVIIPAIAIVWYYFIGMSVILAIIFAAMSLAFAKKGAVADSKLAKIGKILSYILIGLAIVMFIVQLLMVMNK